MTSAAARPSARYRSTIVVFLLALVLLGFFALGRLPVDLPPSRDVSHLNIRVSAPGLTATLIEEILLAPVEAALAGLPAVAAMEALASSGSASIDLRLSHRRDIDMVQREVMARLERARDSWPASIDPPAIMLSDYSSASMEFNLQSRTHDPLALRDWAEAEFARRLRELRGVAAVDIQGGSAREILVMPDQRRLAGYGLSFEDLLQVIRKNPEVTSRVSETRMKKRSRREPILSGSLAALAAIPVVLPDGESIRLSEVARLTLSNDATAAVQSRAEGTEAVRVTVHRQGQAALSEVVEQVRAHVDWMRANRLIPESIEVQSLPGNLDAALQPLRMMVFAFVTSLILVLSAAHLLWGRGRRTLMLGVITVVSLQGAFIVMALSGMALDVMTLGGLVLGTGLFGGSVMLMFAGIDRPVREPADSASPVIMSAVILVAALIPVWFVGGELSALFSEFVVVFATAWLLAALLAWWLVPMFDARRRRGGQARWNAAVSHAMAVMRHSYDGLLRRLLPRAVLWLAVVSVLIVVMGIFAIGKIREAPAHLGSPGQDLVLRIEGPHGAGLLALANETTQRLRTLPELRQVGHSAQASREEWMLSMDAERAHMAGVDIGVAGKALAIATTGITAGSFRDADHHYNVRMRLPPEDSDSVAAGKILLLGELEDRPAVHLRDVATLVRAVVPAQILHFNGKPVIEITARIASESSSHLVMEKVNAILDGTKLPSGYQVFFGRHTEVAPESRGMMALGISALLVMVLATWNYRSLRLGLLIMLSAGITLVATGAVLLTFGLPLSPPVWLGALLLLGLAAGNANALVARCEGASPDATLSASLKQATRDQFLTIFAMVLAAILGMLSLMWINGSVAVLHTLIIFLIGGLLFSLLINLLLTPLLYWLIARKEQYPAPSRQ